MYSWNFFFVNFFLYRYSYPYHLCSRADYRSIITCSARVETCESSWLFPRMVPLLGEADVALPLLHGLLATVGLAGDHHVSIQQA